MPFEATLLRPCEIRSRMYDLPLIFERSALAHITVGKIRALGEEHGKELSIRYRRVNGRVTPYIHGLELHSKDLLFNSFLLVMIINRHLGINVDISDEHERAVMY